MPIKRSLFGAGDGGGRQHVVISESYISAIQSVILQYKVYITTFCAIVLELNQLIVSSRFMDLTILMDGITIGCSS